MDGGIDHRADELANVVLRMNDECNKLRAELETARSGWETANGTAELALKHRDMAEAEIERLRDVLAGVDALDPGAYTHSMTDAALRGLISRMGEIARAALRDSGPNTDASVSLENTDVTT